MDLPSGYTQLEYIESTGTQYIDTGFKPNQNTRVVMDAQMTSISGAAFYFGARATGYVDSFGVLYSASAKAMRSAYGSENLTFATTNYTARVQIDKNKTSCMLGAETLNHTATTFQNIHNLYLFASNEFGTVGSLAKMRLYSCQIYDNGTLIRDYIPCVTDDGQIGLYDTVNNAFYGNAGTGSFLRGKTIDPVLPDGFIQLEYIESSGTQYIDTGFAPNSNTRIVAEMAYVSFTNSTCGLIGSSNSSGIEFYYYSSTSAQRYLYLFNSTDNNSENTEVATGTKLYIDLAKTSATVTVDGSIYDMTPSSPTDFTGTDTIHIHTLWRSAASSHRSSSRTYALQIYDNGTLVRDFVPCRTSSGDGGLYDVLNGVFYGNAGSGEFLLGAEINPEPIPPTEFPTMVYDRTYADLARAKELAVIGYANMTEAEREEWDGGLRGAYNAIDFNRVENAVLFLCAVLKELPQEIRDFAAELGVPWDSFFDVPYSTDALNLKAKNTWKVGEIPTKAEKSRYLSNVVELRRTLDYETDMLPVSMDGLTIDGANAIEKALVFLHAEIDKFRQMRKTQIENTVAAWFYAGEIYANEV